MARPRKALPDSEIAQAHAAGASIAVLARRYDVDRGVIRRIVVEAGQEVAPRGTRPATVLAFPAQPGITPQPSGLVTSTQLVGRAAITYRQFDYWVRTGRLRPAGDPTPGQGYSRFFPVAEVAVARLMGDLVYAGLSPDAAHRIARELTETGTSRLAGITIHLPEEH